VKKSKETHSHSGHEHGHLHVHGNPSDSEVRKALIQAMVITFIFMIVELVGGLYSNSLALISDSAHMLTDIGAILMSLFAFWFSRRPSKPTMSFGYHRAEILGALTSGIAIWFIAGILILEAIHRVSHPPQVNGKVLLVVSIIGLLANVASMRVLHSAQKRSLNVKAAYRHLLSDLFGSLGAVIAGVEIWVTDWKMIDLIVTGLFSILMLISSWDLIKESVAILMESSPSGIDPQEIRTDLQGVTGVLEVHDLHVWSVSSGRLALSVHLISTESEGILERAHQVLSSKHGIRHTTIQVEHPERFNSERCYDCANNRVVIHD
jgi:cobalt-zinc-cadmium efflux system protein